MNRTSVRALLYGGLAALSFLTLACQPSMEAPDQGSYTQNSELPYCGSAQATAYSGTTSTITGLAKFAYRPLDIGSCSGLCGDPVSLGIPYAEVQVSDSSGARIQCGETDANGNYSLIVPRKAGTYKVTVNSRSYTNKVRASVLEDIYGANPYSISTTVSLSSSQTTAAAPTMTASARLSEGDGKVAGGAFNILADVYWANQFLRAQSGTSNFVAEKVSIFWKAGFNPYSYFGAPTVLASFFVASEDRLYILGGKNGDVKASDTDHFDDSVILHEYGHFLEAHYSHSDSPGSLGGFHNGNFIIDPRMAWSEGFANYFQGAVLDNVVYASGTGPKGTSGFTSYVDSIGFKSDTSEGTGSGAGLLIKRSLTESVVSAVYDKPATNEGIFREFSISRTLFKTLKASIPFQYVWESFLSLHDTVGNYTPLHKFINFGVFNAILNSKIADATMNNTWTSILTEEKQKKDVSLYGNLLVQQNPSSNPTCPSITMSPVADTYYGYDRSNQLMSNDFFTFYHDGIAKRVGFVTSSTGVVDMNLYLYADGYYYSEEAKEIEAGFSNPTMLRTSKTINFSSTSEVESIDMSGLPAGYYFVNVKASTLNKTSASLTNSVNYYLFIANGNTVTKCLVPSP